MKGGAGMLDGYINQYGRRLYGLCLTLCANKFEADDLYQDTWLKALKNIEQYDTKKPFEPWLTQICVNIFRNNLRRLAKTPFFNGFQTTKEKERLVEGSPSPITEDYAYIHEAVDSLPEKFRITVILFYFEEMKVARVANILSIPIGIVKSRLHKARKLLREVLKDETNI